MEYAVQAKLNYYNTDTKYSRVTAHTHFNGTLGLNQYLNTVPGSGLDQIEIVSGPSGVQYGSDGLGGTIHLRTVDPSSEKGSDLQYKGFLSSVDGTNTHQVSGYTISKFIGIKLVSEISAKYRAVSIVGLIAIAELALLLFAVTPAPWNGVWLFVNGRFG